MVDVLVWMDLGLEHPTHPTLHPSKSSRQLIRLPHGASMKPWRSLATTDPRRIVYNLTTCPKSFAAHPRSIPKDGWS